MGNFIFSTETFTFFFDNIECIRLQKKMTKNSLID